MSNIQKKSAGVLVYRFKDKIIEFMLVHPGGPFFTKKDMGVWSIPKGEFDNEEPLEAAKREFGEEIGLPLSGTFIELSPIVQKGGKTVFAWAIESYIDINQYKSNTFQLEWPIKSGKFQDFPEVDKVEWFPFYLAKEKINANQALFISELVLKLNLEQSNFGALPNEKADNKPTQLDLF